MIEVLQNTISSDGMRTVRVVCDQPLTEGRMLRFVPVIARAFAQIKLTPTAALSLFHGEVVYPVRGVVPVRVACGEGRVRRLAVWRVMPQEGYRLSELVAFLAEWYFAQTHQRARFGFVRKLPREAVSGQLLAFSEEHGIELLEAEWAFEKCVMVGG